MTDDDIEMTISLAPRHKGGDHLHAEDVIGLLSRVANIPQEEAAFHVMQAIYNQEIAFYPKCGNKNAHLS